MGKATRAVLEEIAKRAQAGEDLAMDYVSRMARAKEQGFNVDDTLYHGTSGLSELKAFDKSQTGKGADQYGPGFYLTTSPHQASGYAQDVARGQGTITGDSKGVIQSHTSGNLLDVDGTTTRGMEDSITLDEGQVKSMLMESDALKRGIDSDDMNPLGDYYDSFWSDGPEEWMIDDLAGKYAGRNPEELTDLFDDNDKFLSALSDVTGYDGIRVNWPDVSHEVHWKPENIRSTSAAFDPKKKDSSNLLAGLGAAGIGIGGMGATPASQAALLPPVAGYAPAQGEINTNKGTADILGLVGNSYGKEITKGLGGLAGLGTGDTSHEAEARGERWAAMLPEYNLGVDAGMMLDKAYKAYTASPNAENQYLDPKRWAEEYMNMGNYWGDKAANYSPLGGALIKGGLETFQP